MEIIRGKTSLEMNLTDFQARLAGHRHILLDLGTGDGRFARHMAEHNPTWFILGLDACRENLQTNSQAKLTNLLFVIANAQMLPLELNGLATSITINFPWGSLLASLLDNDAAILQGLYSAAGPSALVDVRLNGGALAEAGWRLETGAERIHRNLIQAGWKVKSPSLLEAGALRAFPSTWARRLAFGRDPRAIILSGRLAVPARQSVSDTVPVLAPQ